MISKSVIPYHIVIAHFHQPEAQIHVIVSHSEGFAESSGLPEYLCPQQQTGTGRRHTILWKTVPPEIIASVIFQKLQLMHRSHRQIDDAIMLDFHGIRIIQL